MTFVDHRIDERMSRFWPVSDEQQALSAVEIVLAAEGIRRDVWGDHTPPDPALRRRLESAIARLCRGCPLSICVVHDNEQGTDRAGMLGALKEAFRKFGDGPVFVGVLDIFVVLVRSGGSDVFVGVCDTFDYDERPSEVLPRSRMTFLGAARSPAGALQILALNEFFRGAD